VQSYCIPIFHVKQSFEQLPMYIKHCFICTTRIENRPNKKYVQNFGRVKWSRETSWETHEDIIRKYGVRVCGFSAIIMNDEEGSDSGLFWNMLQYLSGKTEKTRETVLQDCGSLGPEFEIGTFQILDRRPDNHPRRSLSCLFPLCLSNWLLKKNSVALVRERTMPTERPSLFFFAK
jgi:hypothetical protein